MEPDDLSKLSVCDVQGIWNSIENEFRINNLGTRGLLLYIIFILKLLYLMKWNAREDIAS